MIKYFKSEKYGTIIYKESFWTGKRIINVGGVVLAKDSKKMYIGKVNGGPVIANVNGNIITGITLGIGKEDFYVSPKTTWYEMILFLLPILFALTWGNVPQLCMIFPVIGGAIGGFVGGLLGFTSLYVMKKTYKPLYKVLIGLGMLVGTILTNFIIAVLYLTVMSL